nr:MAG TPA: hypothetical protein [Caudoviricetes sp.]
MAINRHLRARILLIDYRNDGVKPLLQLKRSIKKSLISSSFIPRIRMIILLIINPR